MCTFKNLEKNLQKTSGNPEYYFTTQLFKIIYLYLLLLISLNSSQNSINACKIKSDY